VLLDTPAQHIADLMLPAVALVIRRFSYGELDDPRRGLIYSYPTS
jgi:hypothetical protein